MDSWLFYVLYFSSWFVLNFAISYLHEAYQDGQKALEPIDDVKDYLVEEFEEMEKRFKLRDPEGYALAKREIEGSLSYKEKRFIINGY